MPTQWREKLENMPRLNTDGDKYGEPFNISVRLDKRLAHGAEILKKEGFTNSELIKNALQCYFTLIDQACQGSESHAGIPSIYESVSKRLKHHNKIESNPVSDIQESADALAKLIEKYPVIAPLINGMGKPHSKNYRRQMLVKMMQAQGVSTPQLLVQILEGEVDPDELTILDADGKRVDKAYAQEKLAELMKAYGGFAQAFADISARHRLKIKKDEAHINEQVDKYLKMGMAKPEADD